jgi:RHS repeat-associated protein
VDGDPVIAPLELQTVDDGETAELHSALTEARSTAAGIPAGIEAGVQRQAVVNKLDAELEAFVANHPNSAWTPWVRFSLGQSAQSRCGYSRAIDHYRNALAAVKDSSDSSSQRMTRKAASGLAKLLALTGRLDDLDALGMDVQRMNNGTLITSDWKWAMAMRAWVRKNPTDAYKCGLYCLDQLGRLTQPGQFLPKDVLETDSSTNGFSAADLVRIGTKAGLHVHAGQLSDFNILPVPCVVHLRSEHFVVVRERQGAFYRVLDPVAFGPKSLTATEIAQEATGCVLLNDATAASTSTLFKPMNETAAAAYRGRCHGPLPYDHDDSPDPCHHGDSCSACTGMPKWFVSEPFLGLWVDDIPLQYQPPFGPTVTLRLAYTNYRTSGVVSRNGGDFVTSGSRWHGGSFGNTDRDDGCWSCSWLSFAEFNNSENIADLMMPGGGWATFTFPTNSNVSNVNYRHNLSLEKVGSPGAVTSLILHDLDGSQTTYAVLDNSSPSYHLFYMSDTSDPPGNKTTFAYDTHFLMTNVTAADATTFSLYYLYNPGGDLSQNFVTNITTSYGSTVSIDYDYPFITASQITGITDAAGIHSQINYEGGSAGGYVKKLITPYGTTQFSILGDTNSNPSTEGIFVRTVRIALPDGAQEFYAQLDTYTNSDWPDFATNQIPTNTPLNTLDASPGGRQQRNTFYWNALQFAPFVNVALTNSSSNGFCWNAFKQSHIQHWLANTDPTYTHFDTLSSEQSPSPDGITEGQITWYDYVGKPTNVNYEIGKQVQPSVVARVMPDGSTWYRYLQNNIFGYATNQIEKWVSGGTGNFRTNTVLYATNNIDLLATTDALGVLVSSNIYNNLHQVLTNYNALNQTTVYAYDSQHRLYTVQTPAAVLSTLTYGSDNRLATRVDSFVGGSAVRTNSYVWNSNGTVRSHTDERGLVLTNYWDGLHRLTSVLYPDGTTTSNLYSLLTGQSYTNSSGSTNILDLTATKDRLGNWTYFVYDAMRRRTYDTNVLGTVTAYGYCDCGVLEYVTNALNTSIQAITHYVHDDQARISAVLYPDGSGTTNYYDSLGRVTNVISAYTSLTSYFNNLSLLVAVSNAVGRVQSTAYDVLDRATNVVDANGVTIANTYDKLDRLLTRAYPDGGVERYGYTLDLRRVSNYTNQLGSNVVGYSYDGLARKTNEVYPGIATNKYTYSPAGDLVTLTDGKNQTTTWKYDQYGRVTNKIDAASNELLRYSYDANNRLTNRWTPGKTNAFYSYDAVGNLTNVAYAVSHAISLAYDALNRLKNMVDAVGTTIYVYTSADLVQSEDGPWANDTVNYVYNNTLRTSLTLQAPNATAWSQTYGYDAAGRLQSLSSPAGSFTYTYDPGLGGVTSASSLARRLVLPNGAYITNAFDSVARLLSTTLKNSVNTTVNSHTYGYNAANQRTAMTNTSGDYRNYAYDSIGQLQTAKGYEANSSSNRWHEQLGYSYDFAGNLNYRTNNALVQTFNVNNLNELTTGTRSGTLTVAGTTTSSATNVTVNSLASDRYADNTFSRTNLTLVNGNNTFTAVAKDSYGRSDTQSTTYNLLATNNFTYDPNGNLTYDGNRAFDYDDENQLFRVTVTNSWKSEFTYDGKFRRRIRKEFLWQNGGWAVSNELHYLYDGNLVIQERDGNNIPIVSYTRGRDLSAGLQGAGGIGGFLARTDNSTIIPQHAFYHADGNGNVTILVNTLQLVSAKYLYDPFGNTLSRAGPLADVNTYRFSSQEYHQNSGLIMYLRRAYDPNLQRWLNRDPLQELGGINLFRFVGNSPLNNLDSDGRFILSLGFLAKDLWTLGKNIAAGKASLQDSLWVAADVLAVAADVVSGGTGGEAFEGALAGVRATRVLQAALKGAEVVSAADVVVTAAHAGDELLRTEMSKGKGSGGAKNWRDLLDDDCPKFQKMEGGDNQYFNKMFKSVMEELFPGITRDDPRWEMAHLAVTGQGITDRAVLKSTISGVLQK